jgi:Lrp/AsnC family transcriptional regulator, leucine-responsive regulatory protein
MDLDSVDRQLLLLLQEDADRTIRDLADRVGVSAPTCLRRIRRMKERKLLLGTTAIVDPTRAGFSVQAIFEVKLHETNGAALRRFEAAMRAREAVGQCLEVAGELDYLLMVVAGDMADLGRFIERALSNDANVASFRTHIVLRKVVDRRSLPLRELA